LPEFSPLIFLAGFNAINLALALFFKKSNLVIAKRRRPGFFDFFRYMISISAIFALARRPTSAIFSFLLRG